VGSGSSEATEIRDWMELVVEIPDSHSGYFHGGNLLNRARDDFPPRSTATALESA